MKTFNLEAFISRLNKTDFILFLFYRVTSFYDTVSIILLKVYDLIILNNA